MLFFNGGNAGIGIVKATEENTWVYKVASTIDGIEDSGKGGATVGVRENVVAYCFQLLLEVTGGHQSSSDTGCVIQEDMLVTTVGVGRYL